MARSVQRRISQALSVRSVPQIEGTYQISQASLGLKKDPAVFHLSSGLLRSKHQDLSCCADPRRTDCFDGRQTNPMGTIASMSGPARSVVIAC